MCCTVQDNQYPSMDTRFDKLVYLCELGGWTQDNHHTVCFCFVSVDQPAPPLSVCLCITHSLIPYNYTGTVREAEYFKSIKMGSKIQSKYIYNKQHKLFLFVWSPVCVHLIIYSPICNLHPAPFWSPPTPERKIWSWYIRMYCCFMDASPHSVTLWCNMVNWLTLTQQLLASVMLPV